MRTPLPTFHLLAGEGLRRRGKSASPRGLNDRMPSPSLPPPSSPPLAHSTAPFKKCTGGYAGNFGSALAFATKAYRNTTQKLGEMVRDPDAGLRKFAESTLAVSGYVPALLWGACE